MKIRISTAALLAAGALLLPGEEGVQASSHREAPFITKMPKVDATDFYMFRSYEEGRSDFVTIIADYLPLQDAYGGPNFFAMDPDALYEIHVDNDGDAKEDITFQFRFQNSLAAGGAGLTIPVGPEGQTKDVAVPLRFLGPVPGHPETANIAETYGVTVVRGNRRTGTAADIVRAGTSNKTFEKPADNVGNKTIPDYATYASGLISEIDIPGCTPPSGKKARVFVGQRKDPFVVNLGQIFDLLNFNALGAPDIAGTDKLDDKNVTSIEIEVPASCLVKSPSTTIGGWTTASVRQARVINPSPTYAQPSREGGAWAQVSRLGMPLVNEVVIGLPDKDHFNASEPKDDAQFATYVTNPTLPELIEIVYGAAGVTAPAPNAFPRADLVAVFLTGVEGVNKTGDTPGEMLRLNTALPATPKGSQTYLGAAACFDHGTLVTSATGCDVAGFPNGRRPGDDVVDIALRVVMGYLLSDADAPAGQAPLTDNAKVDDSHFDAVFPYLMPPLPGSP
jgi:hypothetical protein